MASPHELHAVAQEVELIGVTTEAHRAWVKLFRESVATNAREVLSGTYAAQDTLLFVPAKTILSVMRRVIPRATVLRMEELLALISQRAVTIKRKSLEHEDESKLLSHDRWTAPSDGAELKKLCLSQGVSESEMREWAVYRTVLNSYGWLARRVGNFSVPLSSLIHGVFKAECVVSDKNDRGLFSRRGMVAIRGSRLQELWGKNWFHRFDIISNPSIADGDADVTQKLLGLEDSAPPEEDFKLGTA